MSLRSDSRASAHVTFMGGYVAAILHAAIARGADRDVLLRAARLEKMPANDPLVRIPFESFRRLMQIVVETTGDPYFGLYASNFVHASNLHALGLSMLASASVRDLCTRLCRYFRFISGASPPTFTLADGDARLEFMGATATLRTSHEAFGVFLVRTIRELSGGAIGPILVELAGATPADGGLQHARAFGCDVRFDAPYSIVHFDPSQVDLPFEGASRELAEHNERIVIRYVAQLDRGDIESRVRAILMQDLPTGVVTKENVARKLAMSPRTLQIKLANHGTSFQSIVDETRHALACGYMDNSSITITEIAYLLGFSDTSNFSRAFRRWSGRSPSEQRAVAKQAEQSRRDNGVAGIALRRKASR